MNRLETAKNYYKKCILGSMARIEEMHNKMFHEIMPEVDEKFHEMDLSEPQLEKMHIKLINYIENL